MSGLRTLLCVLWCLVLPSLSTGTCTVPNNKCTCNETPLLEINCTAADLQTIPLNLPPVVTLIITQDEITILPNIPYTDLVNLHLKNNKIRFIEDNAFNGLDKVKKLDLTSNEISGLQRESFDGLDNVRYLFLDGNKLLHIQTDLFSHETLPEIVHLLMSNCSIYHIQEGAFDGLNKLMVLNISGNNLLVPPKLSKTPALESLDMSHNELGEIPMTTFEGLSSLKHLHLHHNQLRVLNDDTFAGLTALLELDLADNYIALITPNALLRPGQIADLSLQRNDLPSLRQASVPQNLSRLSIYGNPWDCTCDIAWMRDDAFIRTWNPTDMTCTSPEKAAGSSIQDADPHLFDCNDLLHGFHGNTVALAVGILVAVCVFLFGMAFLVKIARSKGRQSGLESAPSRNAAAYRRVRENNIFMGDQDTDHII